MSRFAKVCIPLGAIGLPVIWSIILLMEAEELENCMKAEATDITKKIETALKK